MKLKFRIPRPVVAFGLALAGTLLASPEALAQGCAMCKTAVGGAEDPLSKALTASSIFMIVVPLSVMATIASWVALSVRRGQLETVAFNETENSSNLSEKGNQT